MSPNQSPNPPPGTDTPPRDSASVVLLRDGRPGLQVLLMQRSKRSAVLGGAYVFPGGKLERSDSTPATLARLDCAPNALRQALAEPQLDEPKAAGLFVAAIRETAEEVGVFLCQPNSAPAAAAEPFAALVQQPGTVLTATALAPWSRWITPPHQKMIERRFDTRFFLAQLPAQQAVHQDDFEATALRWMTPQQALRAYYQREIDLIPPQIISLMHLSLYGAAGEALQAARLQPPPRIQPHILQDAGRLTMCYPGDPMHPVDEPAFPAAVPTRLIMHNGRFEPPNGTTALLA